MKINREDFLNALNRVKAGLSPREFIEQSSCFVFKDGKVMTFNDEVACQLELTPEMVGGTMDITGAVQATKLTDILEKLNDPELEVRDNEQGQLEFKGKRKAFGIIKDSEIFLPIDKVEAPGKWFGLDKEFTQAIGMVQHCVSSDESRFQLTCVHIHPDHIEACDNLQIMRVNVKTRIKRPVLVRGSSIATITDLGMDSISLTKSWIHFRNSDGLVMSCRAYAEEYPALDKLMEVEGSPIVIPKGLKDAATRATVFASDQQGDPQVVVKIKDGKVRIVGEGLAGWYKEVSKVAYDGPPISFAIAPRLLGQISDKYKEAVISDHKLRASSEMWSYVTVLGQLTEREPDAE